MLILRSRWLLPGALAAALCLSAAPARADGGSRWVAAVPFGAGQFQNGDTGLGIFFAVGEAALGGTSIAAVIAANMLAAKHPVLSSSDAVAMNESIRTAAMVNRFAFAGWAALTVAGVIEAQVGFGPRKERPRPSIMPVATPLPGGAWVAVQGTF